MRRSPTVSSVIQSRNRKTPKDTKSAGTQTSHRGSNVQNEVAESKLSAVLDTWHRKIHFLIRWIEMLIFESDSQLIIQTKTTFFIPKKEPEFESEHRFTSWGRQAFPVLSKEREENNNYISKLLTVCKNGWLPPWSHHCFKAPACDRIWVIN